jgi:hypothetical protein
MFANPKTMNAIRSGFGILALVPIDMMTPDDSAAQPPRNRSFAQHGMRPAESHAARAAAAAG